MTVDYNILLEKTASGRMHRRQRTSPSPNAKQIAHNFVNMEETKGNGEDCAKKDDGRPLIKTMTPQGLADFDISPEAVSEGEIRLWQSTFQMADGSASPSAPRPIGSSSPCRSFVRPSCDTTRTSPMAAMVVLRFRRSWAKFGLAR